MTPHPQPPASSGATSASSMAAPPLATRLPFELHVANIPADLTRDGMFNLFGKYGEVTEVYLRELTPTLLLSPSPTALEYFFFATPAKFGLFHFSDSLLVSDNRNNGSGGRLWGNVTFSDELHGMRAKEAVDAMPPFFLVVRKAKTEAERREERELEEANMRQAQEKSKLMREFDQKRGMGMNIAQQQGEARGRGQNLKVS
jgi:hypothetical protein